MGVEFRSLRADEIECRIGQIARNGNGLSLLLYKDARCDANILDETVGLENWQCEFYECKGTLFCKVGIAIDRGEDFKEWVWKDDAGSPSNMEAQKGEASDAFKRACFKWGIGRELYTTPRIWIYGSNCNIKANGNGKYQCYDDFSVERIAITDHKIEYVSIRNETTGAIVFEWLCKQESEEGETSDEPTREQLSEISGLIESISRRRGVDKDVVIKGLMESKAMRQAGVQNGEIMTGRQAATAIGQLKVWMEK